MLVSVLPFQSEIRGFYLKICQIKEQMQTVFKSIQSIEYTQLPSTLHSSIHLVHGETGVELAGERRLSRDRFNGV